MTYQLLLHKSVTKFLKKSPAKQRQVLKEKLEQLKQDPLSRKLDIKLMQGYVDLYRLRVGQIRFIYQIKNNELIVFVIKAGHRGDVYKAS